MPIWFGTKEKMKNVKAFISPLTASSTGFSQTNQFANGGADVVGTYGRHHIFQIGVNGDDATIADFEDAAYGLWGKGTMHFLLPSWKRTNCLPPNWTVPRLIELTNGWPNIGDATPTFADTAANATGQPSRTGTWTVPAATIPVKKTFIPIGPNEKLWLGWTGSATGGSAVYYRPVLGGRAAGDADYLYGTPVALSPIAVTSTTRINASVLGSTCIGVDVYFYGATAGTVSISSMVAQVFSSTFSPTTTGVFGGLAFPRGRGIGGCKFENELDRNITMDTPDGRVLMGLVATLVETGLWALT